MKIGSVLSTATKAAVLCVALVFGILFASCGDGGGNVSGGGGGGGDGGGGGGGVSSSQTITVPGGTLTEKLRWIRNNVQNGNTFIAEVSADETIASHLLSYGYKPDDVTIILRGSGGVRTISGNGNEPIFDVGNYVILVLDNNITLRGQSNNDCELVRLIGGELVMNAGSRITGNNRSSGGGGVYMSGGTFTMNGGEISGNTAAEFGGGVYMVGGNIVMNSGKISGNTVISNPGGDGGGVFMNGGTFTMNGGEISGNTALNHGGGVYIFRGTLTMYGGEISGNTAANHGGGLSLNYVGSGQRGILRIVTGTIYGLDAVANLRNTVTDDLGSRDSAALFVVDSLANAQYGTFSGTTWNSAGSFPSTSETIRVVNGVLQ